VFMLVYKPSIYIIGTAAKLRAGRPRNLCSICGGGKEFFCPSWRLDLLWGPHSLLYNWYPETVYPRMKRPEHEADYSPPYSVNVKNGMLTLP
jgi:hypothetical protein